ncbi:MAG: 6-carboxytetrahydropterin synthase [Chitinophagales bacterium]|jgi:6-pyruvoyltetrahydropterin/6-carboxytetrahydropterin synthase|nr:6-carboxytetrahydropterin synthase [Chitinophagales bacterium]HNL07035.1 6-carboxytetrahydropterin synthase [Chitinophagales bacterium]
MIYLTRRECFNAAHKLCNPNWSDEENKRVFGKCANENWHGHNYELFVTVKGTPDPNTGFIINAVDLKNIIQTHIVEKVDHKNLNLDVPFLKDKFPSTENFAKAIWEELQPHLTATNYQLHAIKLRETENIYVEYFGE